MIRTLVYVAAAVLLASVSNPAAAQTAKSLVGAWAPVSSVATDSGGKKVETYGPRPQGMLVFTADGRYTLILRAADLPKFAANSRVKGSAAENQAVVAGSIAHFGRYIVDEKEKTFTFQIQGATFPNWDGQSQKRPFAVKGDQLIYQVPNPSAGGGAGELIWRRLKPEA